MTKVIDLDKARKSKEPVKLEPGLTGVARILPVLIQWTDLDPSVIQATSTWTDLDIDSLERVEICIELEDLLGIDLDADEFEDAFTVGEFAALVDKKMEAKANG